MLDPAQPFIQSNQKVGLFCQIMTVNQNTDIVQQAAPARHPQGKSFYPITSNIIYCEVTISSEKYLKQYLNLEAS